MLVSFRKPRKKNPAFTTNPTSRNTFHDWTSIRSLKYWIVIIQDTKLRNFNSESHTLLKPHRSPCLETRCFPPGPGFVFHVHLECQSQIILKDDQFSLLHSVFGGEGQLPLLRVPWFSLVLRPLRKYSRHAVLEAKRCPYRHFLRSLIIQMLERIVRSRREQVAKLFDEYPSHKEQRLMPQRSCS